MGLYEFVSSMMTETTTAYHSSPHISTLETVLLLATIIELLVAFVAVMHFDMKKEKPITYTGRDNWE